MAPFDVSVIVLTYNQQQFIERALESIITQQTSYRFEVVIGEDFGTDMTRTICKRYAAMYDNVKLLIQDKNLGVVGNFVRCVKACTGKYIMCCAGDDFWHTKNKIQIQVDYMEKHPECVLCHTDIDLLYFSTGHLKRNFRQSSSVKPLEGMIQREYMSGEVDIYAVTICMKRQAVVEHVPLDKFVEMNFPYEDYPTIACLAAYGQINYIPISTATYMQGHTSITNTVEYSAIRERYIHIKRMCKYLNSLFPELKLDDDGSWCDTFVFHHLLKAAYKNNDYKSAHQFALMDQSNGLMKKMACNIITFKLFRFYMIYVKDQY